MHPPRLWERLGAVIIDGAGMPPQKEILLPASPGRTVLSACSSTLSVPLELYRRDEETILRRAPPSSCLA